MKDDRLRKLRNFVITPTLSDQGKRMHRKLLRSTAAGDHFSTMSSTGDMSITPSLADGDTVAPAPLRFHHH